MSLTSLHPSASKKTNPVTFPAKGIPFHALLPGFWVKMMEPVSITSHDAE
jgi:hypothetical protein